MTPVDKIKKEYISSSGRRVVIKSDNNGWYIIFDDGSCMRSKPNHESAELNFKKAYEILTSQDTYSFKEICSKIYHKDNKKDKDEEDKFKCIFCGEMKKKSSMKLLHVKYKTNPKKRIGLCKSCYPYKFILDN